MSLRYNLPKIFYRKNTDWLQLKTYNKIQKIMSGQILLSMKDNSELFLEKDLIIIPIVPAFHFQLFNSDILYNIDIEGF